MSGNPFGSVSNLRANGKFFANVTHANEPFVPEGIEGITTQEEGVTTGTGAGVTTLNFVGAGVTAAGVGATTTITIPGGGGDTFISGNSRLQEDINALTPAYWETQAFGGGSFSFGKVAIQASWIATAGGAKALVTVRISWNLTYDAPGTGWQLVCHLPALLAAIGAPALDTEATDYLPCNQTFDPSLVADRVTGGDAASGPRRGTSASSAGSEFYMSGNGSGDSISSTTFTYAV